MCPLFSVSGSDDFAKQLLFPEINYILTIILSLSLPPMR
jgi:hypothetical protein